MSLRPLLLALFSLTGSTSFAQEVAYTAFSGPIAPGSSGSVILPQFDPNLGVLGAVRVIVLGQVSGTWGIENTTATPTNFGGLNQYVGAYVPVTLPAGALPYTPNPVYQPAVVTLAAFDGAIDYGGASGVTLTFTNATGDGGPHQETDLYMDAGLQPYAGSGSVTIGVGPIVQFATSIPPGIDSSVTLFAEARVTIRYFYSPLPSRICRALPFSGCPCNNASSIGANGCGNSVGAPGGGLDASGVASLSNDTLVLAGSSMTSSSAYYFQGSTYLLAQIVYGDGLRCVTGTVVRLGIKTNVSGSSQYPEAGDLPISLRGLVPAPGPRYYQVVYHDAASYCTPSQVNATNGLAILWAP